MSYSIYDFLTCPECGTKESDVGVDYHVDSKNVLFSFYCQNCNMGSFEDDFRHYVRCPNCNPDPQYGVDHIVGDITEDGHVQFECEECGSTAEGQIRTRWDGRPADPKFEPSKY